MKGKFVMVDGLDGSGKGVIVDALRQWAEAKTLRILDLRSYCKENGTYPEPAELDNYDVIVSAEPTFCYVGAAIRDELVRDNDRKYSVATITQAFSLDREILYKRIIIPAIKAGKHVFQERGVISSLVYQPVQENIQISDLIKLPGNKLALQFVPTLLVISKVNPETVIKRLDLRDKKDESIFDNLQFQKKIDERYQSGWLKSIFERYGSKVVYVDTNEPKTADDTKAEAIKIWEEHLKT